jgi:drug/metabolite transporter (DMT)-like permease
LKETQHLPSFEIVWLYQLGYVVASILGFWLVIKGLKYVEAGTGGLVGLLEIVVSISLGIIIFNEEPTLKIFIGAILIIVAAALPYIAELLQKQKT